MTGGIGFSRQGAQSAKENRSLVKKGEPFDRIRKNRFLISPKLNLRISSEVYNKLFDLKRQKAKGNGLLKFLIFAVLFVIAALLVLLAL